MEDKIGHEKGDINYKYVTVSNFGLMTFIIIIISFCLILFFSYRDLKFREDINKPGINSDLEKLRKYENKELTTYGYLDKEKGIVRIPIEKAMDEVIKDYKK